MQETCDLLILGSGSTAFAAAMAAQELGKTAVMTEERTVGIIKMVTDAETDEVLGVAMVGYSTGEVIYEAAMALRFHATLRDFIDVVHVYPTMAEALKIAAIARFKGPRQLSCCAE